MPASDLRHPPFLRDSRTRTEELGDALQAEGFDAAQTETILRTLRVQRWQPVVK